MQPDANKPALAGGVLILLGFLLGSALGIARGQASIGAILGVAGGALLAVLVWLLNRRRDP